MNSSLSLQALRYGHRQPLFAPLTLACRPGEIWAVLGANGRGKSTLLDTLTGVLPPLGGEMQCEGGVALVPQSFRPAFRWRVSDVVLMGRARHVDLFAQPDEEDARRVEQALAQLGIAALAEDDFGALSGGQQQLVLIARALVSASQNILLDEPCSALDLGNQQVVLQLIGDLAHRQARTVLFTTHDPNHALQVASHTLLLLPEGRWLAGETADVLSETHLRQAYGLPVRLIRHAASAFPLLAPGLRCVAERHKTRLPEIPLANVVEDKAIQGQRGGIGPETRQLVIAANIPRRRDGQGTQIVAGGQRGAIVRIADKQIRQILANKPRAGYLSRRHAQ
ncbi:cobalamin/Fe3+-siderophores ABC transporter ATPase [Klebsiella pneumoniae subsp. pneumoniae]|nr:cobalamin/Fe3+-siderophores ABC transporter ATPase [Klebsiella pneumoniae subsp. pneumoniae]